MFGIAHPYQNTDSLIHDSTNLHAEGSLGKL